ncbi:MAG: nucleoside-diphosphate sugar epimerase/dehydratase [Verrucomicrobiota bacterium]|nr:nucleoside-diphosphate sugar epimerase/dehydratase [Verrucomicrobiota bacterium]
MLNTLNRIAFLFRQLLYTRGLILLVSYGAIFTISLYTAYLLRFDFAIQSEFQELFLSNLYWVVPLKLALMFAFGQFGGLLSYFRLPDLTRILSALTINSAFLVYLWYLTDPAKCPPRSVIMGDFLLSFLLIVGFRVALRVIRERYLSEGGKTPKKEQRVAIVGAGDVGAAIAADLMTRRGLGLRPIIFLDDDRTKWRRHIHGIPVVDSPDSLPQLKVKYGIDSIIIAMPSASAKRVREVINIAGENGLKAEIVPSLAELSTGKVKASRVRPVEIEDLLGREPVALDSVSIREMIHDRIVLVTGAGGSIGSELCRQIASNNPKRLILIEQSEIALFNLENQLNEDGFSGIIQPLIADILDERRMRMIFGRYQPEIVFHAAAHKHVPIMERQPSEAIKNNSYGTALMADLAVEFKIQRFVFISTDKAINPTSVMGVSKRLAEIYLQARHNTSGHSTRFMAVRFGNVLGSSGSVIPIFRKQIAEGGPVKVTHPDMTRYFMTIPEAVGLVLQCATQGKGGEIFVLNMGTPVKIVDLAHQMIELSGFRPDIDIEVQFTGMRPGEKLFEELQHVDEKHLETAHPKILRFVSQPMTLPEVRAYFDTLRVDLDQADRNQIKQRIKAFVPEYSPYMD